MILLLGGPSLFLNQREKEREFERESHFPVLFEGSVTFRTVGIDGVQPFFIVGFPASDCIDTFA